jgi:hypothetical protein
VSGEQKIRAFLFYLGVFIFFIGLPFILSFALSYKFNMRIFRFTKTGLIALKTQPQGASIYLNGALVNEKTPATINELLPGEYNLRLELENHYPWSAVVGVEAGKVRRLDKIILFPLRPNIKQLNKEKISSFWVDKEKDRVYYLNQEENIIYKSDLEGENFEVIGNLAHLRPQPVKWKISPDKEKLLSFNPHQIAVVNLSSSHKPYSTESPLILDFPDHRIIDIFWHSDSYHLILITDSNIEVQEAILQSVPINIVNLEKKNVSPFYDENKDTLYFIDNQKAGDGKFYDNVFKLELSTKFSLIKPRANESQ